MLCAVENLRARRVLRVPAKPADRVRGCAEDSALSCVRGSRVFSCGAGSRRQSSPLPGILSNRRCIRAALNPCERPNRRLFCECARERRHAMRAEPAGDRHWWHRRLEGHSGFQCRIAESRHLTSQANGRPTTVFRFTFDVSPVANASAALRADAGGCGRRSGHRARCSS